METKWTPATVKAELVDEVKAAVESCEDSIANGSRAWRAYHEDEAAMLRKLADEVSALPDDDPRLRRIAAALDTLEAKEVPYLGEFLNGPGIHPDADPPTIDVDMLLNELSRNLDRLR